MVADLGGHDAVARVLGISMTGLAAKTVTRGYHLFALPATPNRVRVASDWLLAAALPTQVVQLSEIDPAKALMASAQSTGIYPHDRRREGTGSSSD
jgi:NADH dehydrogenase